MHSQQQHSLYRRARENVIFVANLSNYYSTYRPTVGQKWQISYVPVARGGCIHIFGEASARCELGDLRFRVHVKLLYRIISYRTTQPTNIQRIPSVWCAPRVSDVDPSLPTHMCMHKNPNAPRDGHKWKSLVSSARLTSNYWRRTKAHSRAIFVPKTKTKSGANDHTAILWQPAVAQQCEHNLASSSRTEK